jgi:ATP-binding cassette subfamily B protein
VSDRSIHALRRTFRLVWSACPRHVAFVGAGEIVAALMSVAELLIAKTLIQDAINRTPIGRMVPALIALGAVLTIQAIAGTLTAELQDVVADRVQRRVETVLAAAALTVSVGDLDDPDFHDRLARAQASARLRLWQLVQSFTQIGSSLADSLAGLVVLISVAPILALVSVIGVVPLWLASRRNNAESYDFAFLQTANERERRQLAQLLVERDAAGEIRLLGLGGFLRSQLDRRWAERQSALDLLFGRKLRRSLIGNIVSTAVLVTAAAVLLWLTSRGTVPVSGAAIAVVVLRQVAGRLTALQYAVADADQARRFVDDVHAFTVATELQPSPSPVNGNGVSGPAPAATDVNRRRPRLPPFRTLRVEHVSFRYPRTDRWVLHDIDFELHAHELVALVGPNGSGKSTLARLLCHLYEPDHGRILWDGVDVRDLDADALAAAIAPVFQRGVVYPFNAATSIALGRSELLDHGSIEDLSAASEELRSAVIGSAKAAGIHSVLQGLPNGYETPLRKEFVGGVELSGGQMQRVGIARAFMRDASFLVLDEPNAALDPDAEVELLQRMHELAGDRSVVMISHRYSAVRFADRILVLDEGRLVETGSHESLLAQGGLYDRLYHLQTAPPANPIRR